MENMASSKVKLKKRPPVSRSPDIWARFKEIDMFFAGRGKVHQTMRRVARQLRAAGIDYALLGGMAVNAHGAERTTKDVDLLLTPEGLIRFQKEMVGTAYDSVPGRPRRFTDKLNGVTIDILVTGRFPGTGPGGPFPFPDPHCGRHIRTAAHGLRPANRAEDRQGIGRRRRHVMQDSLRARLHRKSPEKGRCRQEAQDGEVLSRLSRNDLARTVISSA
jgi:hypothetical protein